ncbi:UNKNOWN [Stylonychia lemnae]|uniref:Uncharacterized protein n=1 Tax=Stylonychia lemnae TaxID=5949 RepID=A0A078AMR5_STYLE|nr:UNKNOWN [Stylonychia lemnae]|eukprot:CDW82163.1 UNKNOWN [Stylonychia lemnae]
MNQESSTLVQQNNQNSTRKNNKSSKKQQFHRSTIQVKQLSLEQQMYQTQIDNQNNKQLSIFDELNDVKNRHFQSQQRSITPLENHNIDYKAQQNQHTQSLNREFCSKNFGFGGKNQLYLRQSMISRNSSAKSFAERSQKEILSPFYKPFEIFFTNRKKSPYLTQRSQNQSACSPKQEGGTFQSQRSKDNTIVKNSQLVSSFQPQNSYNNQVSFRSKTPSFHTIMTDKINRCSQFSSMKNKEKSKRESIANENVQNTKSAQSYFNQHIKKKIIIESQKRFCNNQYKLQLDSSNSKNEKIKQRTSNSHTPCSNKKQNQIESRRNSRNINQKQNNTYQAFDKNRLQTLRIEQEKFLRNSEDDLNYSTDNDIEQINNTMKAQVVSIDTRQKAITKDQQIQTLDEHHSCNAQTLNPETEDHVCCHAEGQRHQMTRYALEKALKLAEILMKEVQRLDNVVQNHNYVLAQHNLADLQTQEYTEKVVEKKQMSKVKRELFKEIDHLNRIQQDTSIKNPSSENIRDLYSKTRNHIEKTGSMTSVKVPSTSSRISKNQKENNCLKDSSLLLADVTACVKQLDRKMSGRILGRQ